MAHNHNHTSTAIKGKKLLWVALLNITITIVQIVGGILANSLSLLSDALHNLGDSSAIFIAFLAGKHSEKQADKSKTFGYKRIEILAALFNAVTLIVISLFLFYEAYKRFLKPEPIHGKLMIIVAFVGLLANLVSVLLLQKEKDHNLNIRAAYLHLIGDTLSSVAVILGGIAIWLYDVVWIDPLITVLVGIYIIYHTWHVVNETVNILMQASPKNIDLDNIKKEIESIEIVSNLHHIHVWQLDDKHVHLEAHINLKNDLKLSEINDIRKEIIELLYHDFQINHTTLQIGFNCCEEEELIVAGN